MSHPVEMELNINALVNVTLNEDGLYLLTKTETRIPEKFRKQTNEDGTYTFFLWELMQIFGSAMKSGLNFDGAGPFDRKINVMKNNSHLTRSN